VKEKTKFIAFLIFKIIKYSNNILFFFFKRNFIFSLLKYLQGDISKIKISQKKELLIYNTSETINWRVNRFFDNEPEILDWIDSFKKNKGKIIFWDIGANIGLYSLYAATIHKKISVFSFEPSIKNLLSLLKNILINKLFNKINIINNPISNTSLVLENMFEKSLDEGTALNYFNTNRDNEGKKHSNKIRYKLLSLNVDELIQKKSIEIPHYIKIDVDGNEHLILKGANKTLNNMKLKEIYIEINQKYYQQKKVILDILKRKKFKIVKKFQKKNNTYNYIFKR
tara:strand:+ start:359 stop:1207 length:849 start_codon:yes stop_codon:yes gene_type:complete